MLEQWHSQFNPKQFLSKVNIDRFIEHNEAYNENRVEILRGPCILCESIEGPGLLLNDGAYLCKKCFSEVSNIQYPEKYERLKREFYRDREARHQARELFNRKCPYRRISSATGTVAFFSLILIFIKLIFVLFPLGLFITYRFAHKKHEARLREWDSIYPSPVKPTLRHFHDPLAELTHRDRSILKVFNNWPGYPPFWEYLRQVIIDRDKGRCQVSGCPSRVELHIHHTVPVSQGGEHIPTNLIALCSFHHALEPDEGHERIWGNIKTRFFTIVCAHKRRNPSSIGYHDVRAHVRRLELINERELSELIDFYGLSCSNCGNGNLTISMNKQKQQVAVSCSECSNNWVGFKKLTEETGPRLAEVLNVTRNKGQWKPRWDMLEERADSTFRLLKVAKTTARKKPTTITSKKSLSPNCPKCGASMRLIKPRNGQHWRQFWGCTKYSLTGCKGSMEA